ncbi:phosphoribosyl transferase [Candidatus Parcubacteria bacterium]|nr:phosphoribosyl transferase [Candidatus Parcubacteria bacterium]
MRYQNRSEAGQLLAKKMDKYKSHDAVIYALPRGGVVLGLEIAKYLDAPLDLVIPRKIGHPSYPEYAVCAITEEGHLICNPDEVDRLDPDWLRGAAEAEQKEAKRRRQLYMRGRPSTVAEEKLAIIVDDGIATGLTMMAAIEDVKAKQPARILLAIPVVPKDIAERLSQQVNELVALEVAEYYLGAVGSYYHEFDQVEDEEVIILLDSLRNAKRKTAVSHG